jgi:hypothetical protein
MAIPLNKELYEKAKLIADETYDKSSAYKSGFIVKTYKKMGGKYKNTGKEKDLKRWYEEGWTDVSPLKTDSSYPVYRPTKRINKKTPLTVDEIDKTNLLEQSIIKQVIKGKKNLKPFKGKGINIDDLIPANKVPKNDILWEFSNPKEVYKKGKEYINQIVYKSNKPKKKYMIFDNINNKWIYFGLLDYEDYTKHKDYDRMIRYRKRATNIKGNWKDNPFSPNNLSINILW